MLTIFSKAMSGVITFPDTSNSVAVFNIPHKNVLPAQRFFHFSFSFYEYSFFIRSVFYNFFNINSVTNILNNDI